MTDEEILERAKEIARSRKRTLGRKKRKPKKRGERWAVAESTEKRRSFISRLLDRGATDLQVIEASMQPAVRDDGKPPGLGLKRAAARAALDDAKVWRAAEVRRGDATVREEQAMRLRGHISGAVADKQFSAVAGLERGLARLHGTDAPVLPARRHGSARDLIADALAEMSDADFDKLADGEDEDD